LVEGGDTLRIVDSTPIPVVKIYRSYNSPCFPKGKQTAYGYCASKKEYYYGVNLSLIITPNGTITDFGIHAANVHDLNACKDILKDIDMHGKTLLGDKGYYDGELRITLSNNESHLVVPDKKRHHIFNSQEDRRLLMKRSLVETVIEQLKSHMKIHETLAQSYQGLVTRLTAAILAFTFAQYFNRKTGRPLLAVKSVLV
jgi:hypothetical protein